MARADTTREINAHNIMNPPFALRLADFYLVQAALMPA
jgi:hypothetical protein